MAHRKRLTAPLDTPLCFRSLEPCSLIHVSFCASVYSFSLHVNIEVHPLYGRWRYGIRLQICSVGFLTRSAIDLTVTLMSGAKLTRFFVITHGPGFNGY